MKFSSYEEIVQNYIFLKTVVEELNESYFLHMSREEIKSEKDSIINERGELADELRTNLKDCKADNAVLVEESEEGWTECGSWMVQPE